MAGDEKIQNTFLFYCPNRALNRQKFYEEQRYEEILSTRKSLRAEAKVGHEGGASGTIFTGKGANRSSRREEGERTDMPGRPVDNTEAPGEGIDGRRSEETRLKGTGFK